MTFPVTEHVKKLIALLFFILAAVIFTWPLVLRVHRAVPVDTADPLLNSWIISWGSRTLFTQPTRFFQANIMYPALDVLTYSEHLLAMAVLAAPLNWLSGNPLLAYNLLLFTGLALSGFGCYLLVRELTESNWAGLVGGFLFAFGSYKLSQLSHLQIMFSPFLPFMLLYLVRYLGGGGRRELLLFALFCLVQSLSSWHYLVFCFLSTALLWLWKAASSRGRGDLLRLAAVPAAMVAVLLLLLPLALPYLRTHDRLPDFERNLTEIKGFSAHPGDYLNTLRGNLLYSRISSMLPSKDIGEEKVLYPGLAAVILALLGLAGWARGRKERGSGLFRRGLPLFFLLLAGLSFLLTLGPEIAGKWNPMYMIPYRLGMLRFIRVPARFYVLFLLSLSALAGYGTACALCRVRGGGRGFPAYRAWGAVLLALVMLENVNLPIPLVTVPAGGDVPQVYRWLEREEGAIIELPTLALGEEHRYDRLLGFLPRDPHAYSELEGLRVYFSSYHRRRTANGYSGYFPYSYNRIFFEMQGFPSRRCVELLRGLGITHVVWHWDLVPPGKEEPYRRRLLSTPGLRLAEDFGRQWVLEVEGGPLAPVEALEMEAQAPEVTRPGQPFNLGLVARNPTSSPMVLVEEEPQPARLFITDARDRTVYAEEMSCRTPFFLQAGEEAVLPLRCREAPGEEGDYTLHLELGGGMLGGRSFTLPLQVREMPISEAPSLLDGRVEYAGEGDVIRIPTPEGLFPLAFRITAGGNTYLLAAKESREEEVADPRGLVHLALRFEREGPVWEEQRGTLPCDISPGQSVFLPTLVRPPDTPGRYKLFVGLTDEGFHWFGEVLVLDVVVGDGSG
ncbi:MAG: hypothetical protein ACUVSI_06470 [Actinomycetota bacterium]